MTTRDLLKQLKAGAWANAEEAAAFAADAAPASPQEMQRLLAFLLDTRQIQRPLEHQRRREAFHALADLSLSPELFSPYAKALCEADPVLLPLLAQLLPKVNNVEAHVDLCAAVGDEKPEVREVAAKVLAQLAGPRAFDIVVKLADGRDFAGRVELLEALVPKLQHRALPLLAATLRAGTARERVLASKLAGERRNVAKDVVGATQLLASALRDPHEQVVSQALRALGSLLGEDDFFATAGALADASNVTVRRAFIEALRTYDSSRVLAYLARILRTAPLALRLVAIESLERIGTEAVLPLLSEAIHDKNVAIKQRVLEALVDLSKNGNVELARTVVWLLRSRDVDVRRVAVELARKVGDPSGALVPKLLRLLRDEDWWVRERVMDALVEISGTKLTAHLLQFLTDPSDVVRRFAVGALRRLKDPRSASALARVALGDADWWVREEAVNVLGELQDPRVVPYLVKLLERDRDLQIATIRALQKLRARDACDLLPPLMTTPDAAVRLAVAEMIAELGEPSHLEWLVARGDDGDAKIRAVLETVVARLNLPAGMPMAAAVEARSALDTLLIAIHKLGADDLLLAAGRTPYAKRMGQIQPMGDKAVSNDDVVSMLSGVLSPAQRKELDERREVDLSYQVKSHGLRFRVNCFLQLAGVSAVFRLVRNVIPNIDTLGLPSVVKTFGNLRNGLVLVGGPTGAGKSTTLAALIDSINRSSSRHIVTIEDPIEVVHELKECLVNQRESGTHTHSFRKALRSTLRQDPDVILVGELRDHETISFAVTAAETGHLVFGTVHTVSAESSIDRILHVFPTTQRPQVRSMLSESLRAVVCQYLLRRKDSPTERVLAVEVMINNDAIANLIRKDKAYQISQVLATSKDAGMQPMDASLLALVKQGLIEPYDAYARAVDKKLFEARAPHEAREGAATPFVSARLG